MPSTRFRPGSLQRPETGRQRKGNLPRPLEGEADHEADCRGQDDGAKEVGQQAVLERLRTDAVVLEGSVPAFAGMGINDDGGHRAEAREGDLTVLPDPGVEAIRTTPGPDVHGE